MISSLRPSYAKIYPAPREDLAAETFFHAQFKSNLLNSVTADDMITWFGDNGTHSEDILDAAPECKISGNIIKSTTVETTTMTYSSTNDYKTKLDLLEVATYTINVDNASVVNVTHENEETTRDTVRTTDFDNTVTVEMVEENTIPNDAFVKFIQTSAGTTSVTSNSDFEEEIYTTTEVIDTSSYKETVPESTTADLVQEPFASPVKHINTKLQNIPTKFTKPVEDTPITFAPEIKNDQFILLDKEALWSMLREVVNDEFKSKTKARILDGQKLRAQGFT